jgi:hypothetical protein
MDRSEGGIMTAFLVLVALCFFGPAFLAKARRDDRSAYHPIHRPGTCPDGACDQQ